MFREKDGEYVVYEIQRLAYSGSGPEVKEWLAFRPTEVHTGEPGVDTACYKLNKPWKEVSPIAYAFSASSECWQKLGIHGVFDHSIAIQALELVAKNNPGTMFRAVRRVYSMRTTPLASMAYEVFHAPAES